MPSPKPPDKPTVKATRKALLAYHSELSKYHEKLAQWENMLIEKNKQLEREICEFEDAVEYAGFEWEDECEAEHADECDCGPQDALDGCECEICETWRDLNPAAMRIGTKYTDMTRRPMPESLKAVGDEVEFLEKMFKLKDTRRARRAQRH